MHQGETIHQYGHIVAGLVRTFLFLKLVDDLQAVVIHVRLVNQLDVLRLPIVQHQVDDVALALNHLRLVLNGHLLIGDFGQQAIPFVVAQHHIVQQFQLLAQVPQEFFLVLDDHTLISLVFQLGNQRLFQSGFALVALTRLWQHLIVCHHRLVLLLYDDFIVFHKRLFKRQQLISIILILLLAKFQLCL